MSYNLVTRDGRTLAGILVSDTETAITIRRGEGADDVVPKTEIEELSAAGKSLMPEGFEQRSTHRMWRTCWDFLACPSGSCSNNRNRPSCGLSQRSDRADVMASVLSRRRGDHSRRGGQ